MTVGHMAVAATRAGLEADRLVRLLDSGIGPAVRLDELYEKDISAVTPVDVGYPQTSGATREGDPSGSVLRG